MTPPRKTPKKPRGSPKYRCQFCGYEGRRWTYKGTRCPKCRRDYDAMLAQDEETD